MPRNMKPSLTKPIRLKDIARRAEISVAAVSMALADHPDISPETKRQVREISHVLGYRRAGVYTSCEPPQKRLERIGLVMVDCHWDNHSPTVLPRVLSRQARRGDLRLEIFDVEAAGDPIHLLDQILNFGKTLDGLILNGYVGKSIIEALNRQGIPCVVFGSVLVEDSELDQAPTVGHSITTDQIQCGRIAARRLLACGHQRIAFVCRNAPRGLCHWQWMTGYKLALIEAGMPIDPQLIYISGQRTTTGAQVLEQFQSLQSPPTAYIVPDLTLAHSLVQAHANLFPNAPSIHNNLISTGVMETATFFAMEDYPIILEDIDRMALATINRLIELSRNPMPEPTQLVLAPILRNLPEKQAENSPIPSLPAAPPAAPVPVRSY